MRIHLPNSAFLGNIDPFLNSFDNTNEQNLDITFNKKWVSVHPVVLSMIASLGLRVKSREGTINIEHLEARSKHYFERMGLFRMLNIESGISITAHEPSGRFIPLTQIKTSHELDRFINDMIPLLHTSEAQVDPIKYVVSELVRNVLEHASSPEGAIVSAQFYKKSNTIRIGVSDCGVGIKHTITFSYRADDDVDAIKLALTPGITGTTRSIGGTETNAGAGLFFIKSIAKVNRDFFMIYSGSGMYKLLKEPAKRDIRLNVNPFDDNSSRRNDLPYWTGTSVGIDISLDQNQKFNDLLDLIRQVYRKEIKEKKKNRFKKPTFI